MGTHNIFSFKISLLPILLIGTHLRCVTPANILVFGAVASHSTRLSMFPFMEALADKGHNVTYLSPYENFEDPLKQSKIHYLLPEKLKETTGGNSDDNVRFFDIRKERLSANMWWNAHDFGVLACQALYSDPEFVDWVKSAPKFDLIIMEYAVNECAYGLVHYFKSKLVVYGTSTVFPWNPDSFGLPDESSTMADIIFQEFPFGDKMSFMQRVKNAVSPILFNWKRDYQYFPILEGLTRRGLGLEEIPSFREIERNTSLVLLTTHFTIDLPRSLPPHVVTIGGAVVTKKPKPLPTEMKQFLDSAKNGFIYISFGTVAEFTNFDKEVQLEFINALYSFPDIKFLWKASIQINETLPDNVMLAKWAPQQTVLGHPNIKAFVTHCGMGSTAEAVHFGVPLVLIPVLGEQDFNANALEARGTGIKLEILTLKQSELKYAISEILNNKKYRIAMKSLSKAFKDRPSPPIENGIWWVEYILRHENSNDYLIPLSIRQPWWKRRQIDVWLVLALSIVLSISFILIASFLLVKAVLTALLYFSDESNPNTVKRRRSKLKSH